MREIRHIAKDGTPFNTHAEMAAHDTSCEYALLLGMTDGDLADMLAGIAATSNQKDIDAMQLAVIHLATAVTDQRRSAGKVRLRKPKEKGTEPELSLAPEPAPDLPMTNPGSALSSMRDILAAAEGDEPAQPILEEAPAPEPEPAMAEAASEPAMADAPEPDPERLRNPPRKHRR